MCLRAAGHALGFGIKLYPRYVTTDGNHGDEGSRISDVQLATWEAWRRVRGFPPSPPGVGWRVMFLGDFVCIELHLDFTVIDAGDLGLVLCVFAP